MRLKLILIIIILIIISSCSNKLLFTTEVKKKLESENIELKKIQYYNSKRFSIKRKLKSEEMQLANAGNIKLEGGVYYEQIIIRKRTPGICDSIDDYNMYISFEPGKKFSFSKYYNNILNTNYKLVVKMQTYQTPSEINYDSKKYLFLSRKNKVFLEIGRANLKHFQVNKKVLEGVKVK